MYALKPTSRLKLYRTKTDKNCQLLKLALRDRDVNKYTKLAMQFQTDGWQDEGSQLGKWVFTGEQKDVIGKPKASQSPETSQLRDIFRVNTRSNSVSLNVGNIVCQIIFEIIAYRKTTLQLLLQQYKLPQCLLPPMKIANCKEALSARLVTFLTGGQPAANCSRASSGSLSKPGPDINSSFLKLVNLASVRKLFDLTRFLSLKCISFIRGLYLDIISQISLAFTAVISRRDHVLFEVKHANFVEDRYKIIKLPRASTTKS
ncbi:hypothetical protein NQ317_006720 [Molorchus minor]|uniref:Uncharacterized protein n=1 Tax=Molorchus minor TaxID=1323400 RepID=A0ABQ9K025_9CUCU|nr:hypothetical protein NQ317_006720 [Molorchus minor]